MHQHPLRFTSQLNPQNQPEPNPTHNKLRLSTTSISSEISTSNLSTSKYSFKTGTLKNIYTQKYYPQQKISFKSKNNPYHSLNPLESSEITFTPERKQFAQPKTHLNRSKSQDLTILRFRPIKDPPFQTQLQNNMIRTKKPTQSTMSSFQDRKIQLHRQNMMLKKSISQKRLNFEEYFGSLNKKITFLKQQYMSQQQRMSKITSLVNTYFG